MNEAEDLLYLIEMCENAIFVAKEKQSERAVFKVPIAIVSARVLHEFHNYLGTQDLVGTVCTIRHQQTGHPTWLYILRKRKQ